MKSNSTHNRLLAVACGCMAIANTGCVEWIGEQGVLIIEAAEPATVAGCTATAISGDIGNGVLDILNEVPYTAQLRVVLNIPATFSNQQLGQERQRQPGSQSYGNTDSNTVIVEEAEVYFSDGRNGEPLVGVGALPDGEPLTGFGGTNVRRTPTSGTVYNTQQNLSAQRSFFATAITAEEAQIIANGPIGTRVSATTTERIIANIRFIGYTTGGGQIRSSKFSLPIDICKGCLFPPESLPAGVCPGATVLTNPACSPAGQDTAMVCQ